MCTGPEAGLANLRRCLQNKYVIKFEILGAGAIEKKAGKFLGRVIKWTENGLTYKGDDKLLESLLEEWNVHGVTAVQTPGERINYETDKRADVWKTSEKLGSFTVNDESVRKLRCEFEGGLSWKDVCHRSIIDRDTGDVLERERYVRGMPLRVAESTLIRPRTSCAVSTGCRQAELFGSRQSVHCIRKQGSVSEDV